MRCVGKSRTKIMVATRAGLQVCDFFFFALVCNINRWNGDKGSHKKYFPQNPIQLAPPVFAEIPTRKITFFLTENILPPIFRTFA
jgi:hypothetical protein